MTRHTGAELRVLRERCGISIQWLAAAAGVTRRSVTRWERDEPGAGWEVPEDVWQIVTAIGAHQDEMASNAINMIDTTGATPVIVAYREAEDFDIGNEDGWSPAMHRAMIARIQEEREIRVVWFERVLYDAWRAVHAPSQADSSQLRAMWAATV